MLHLRQRLFVFIVALIAGPLALAQDEGVSHRDLTIMHARSNATPPGAPGVGYMMIRNHGDSADRLVEARAGFANASLHQTTIKDGVAKMAPMTDGVVIPAGGTVRFEPKGKHIMLMGLDRPLEQGERRMITLVFERAGEVDVSFLVKDVGEPMQHDHQHDH